MISVIICTYNRCNSIKDTLNSLLKQTFNNKFNYEIVVIDNNSSDGTGTIIKGLIPKFDGKLRYIIERAQGLSHARNRGIREARGEIAAFTDDDVIVSNNWLESIYDTFAHNECDAIGGKIKPLWLRIPPRWLTKRFYGNLALLDYGDSLFRITSDRHEFYGANFAVKKTLFDDIGYFNVSLGRKGNKLSSGEDTELCYRMLSANKKIYYQPRCVVYHKVDIKRMKKSYFWKWQFNTGRLIFSAQSNCYRKKRYFFGIPHWMLIRLIKLSLRYAKRRICDCLKPDELFEYELDIFRHIGMIYDAFKIRSNTESLPANFKKTLIFKFIKN